jgi:integrase
MPRRKKVHRGKRGSGTYQNRNGRHVIQWTDRDGRRRTKSFPTKELAIQVLAQVSANVIRGKNGIEETTPDAKTKTLSQHGQVWLAERTNASAYTDRNRWALHLEKEVGHFTPNQLKIPELKKLIKALLAKNLSTATVGKCIILLSALYSDLVEDGHAALNPVRLLSKSTRAKYLKSNHDPKKVPFVRTGADVITIFQGLFKIDPSLGVAYVLGALGGLRTGEIIGLRWSDISFDRKEIFVQVQVERKTGKTKEQLSPDGLSPLKDKESRTVPIVNALMPILLDHYRRTGGVGLVCPAACVKRKRSEFLNRVVMAKSLDLVMRNAKMERMLWYWATRHTFASQWVISGGSLEKLREIMGHSSVVVTERYAHLRPDSFTDVDRARLQIDLQAPTGTTVTVSIQPGPVN